MMNYRNIAAGLLRHAGVAVQRVPRPEEVAGPDLPTKGLVVEFVGPAAIGKSTVFSRMRPALKRSWLFEQHTRVGGLPATPDPAILDRLRPVYFERIRRLESTGLDVYRNAGIIRRMSEVVHMSVLAASGAFPRGFLFDEGVGHFFAEQIIALDDAEADAILRGMAFVILLPRRTGTLVDRRLGRPAGRAPVAAMTASGMAGSAMTGSGGTPGDVVAAARTQAEKELAIYRGFAGLCDRLGLRHVLLDAEDDADANARRGLAFLETLTRPMC
jgi:hypothetical protein